MNVATRRVTLLTLFSAKSKRTVSFRLNKIPLSSIKDPQNVADLIKDARKSNRKAMKSYYLLIDPRNVSDPSIFSPYQNHSRLKMSYHLQYV